MAGLVFGEAAGTAATSPWVTLLVALLGSGVVTGLVTAWLRRKTGEGPSAAARDLAEGVGRLVDASESLTLPLQSRIMQLTQQYAELTTKYAAARAETASAQTALAESQAEMVREAAIAQNERHAMKNEMAALAAKLEAKTLEVETMRVQIGQKPGRRSGDAH
ncbi:MAG TPA: hypothetical protein VGM33_03350 [Baekduia sp.]|jgi:chromosome segregation ATPase